MKATKYKCHPIVSSMEYVSMKLGNIEIEISNCERLLGHIGYVNHICKMQVLYKHSQFGFLFTYLFIYLFIYLSFLSFLVVSCSHQNKNICNVQSANNF